jgi:hypothetical protein
MKTKILISVLIAISIFVLISALVFIKLKEMDEDTCKFIIEQTLVYSINQKAIRLETSLDTNWKELDSIQRQRLLEFAKENVRRGNECINYPYLLNGTDDIGAELPIFGRKDSLGNIELRFGRLVSSR